MGIFLYGDLLLPPPSLLNPLLPSVSERVPSVTFSLRGVFRISLTGGGGGAGSDLFVQKTSCVVLPVSLPPPPSKMSFNSMCVTL